jgi:hypothetical protein
MVFIGNIIIPEKSATLLFSMISISEILIIINWHFSLSIFKKEKLIFLISGILYCILTFIFSLSSLILQLGLLLGIAPLVLVVLGVLTIIIAEILMKKKGLLNYI